MDVDPHQMLSRFLAPLRSSGRLFWLPYYTILTALLAAPYLFMRRSRANALLACLLVLQFVDTVPLRRWLYAGVHQKYPQAPEVSHLAPARLGLREPHRASSLAMWPTLVSRRSLWLPHLRLPGDRPEDADQQLLHRPLYREGPGLSLQSADRSICATSLSRRTAAYVVTPAIAAQIAQGPTGEGKCHDLDGFILCSPKTDFGLSPKLKQQGSSAAN